MKKTIKIIAIILLILLLSLTIFVNKLGPSLTAETIATIEEVLENDLPELIRGETGFAQNGATAIWYEAIAPKDSSRGDVLLVMGIANDALAWPDYFIDPLLDNGYRVIRFDNRGTGLSDWVEDWQEDTAYSLEDMAADGIAVLDHLQVRKANVIGVSLGGMIAQTISIQHPERVNSLTTMMSTGDIMDETLTPFNTAHIRQLVLAHLKYGLLKTEKNEVKLQVAARQVLMGEQPYELDVASITTSVLYNLRKRRGYNPKASAQHIAATLRSGSRYEALEKLALPTLVIHGTSDPLIPFEHGVKCAEIIPGAKNLWVDGMGHDLPEMYVEEVVNAILEHFDREINSEVSSIF